MIPKNRSKVIRSLRLKKHREETGCFLAEGAKSVLELVKSDFEVQTVVCTEAFLEENRGQLEGKKVELLTASPSELDSLGSLRSNNGALALARMKPNAPPSPLSGLNLALDTVNDPGNLGAILRIADWFGVSGIAASEDTADFYNPKVLQASMGSFCRVAVRYMGLSGFLKDCPLPVYAAAKGGKPVHTFSFRKDCVILIGSESHGISQELRPLIKETIGIPAYGKAESLNVAMAAAVLCDNYRRLNPAA